MTIAISLDPIVVQFYAHIAKIANLPLEQVLSDALFKLAGELSLESLKSEETIL
jgi:hypothetical protein